MSISLTTIASNKMPGSICSIELGQFNLKMHPLNQNNQRMQVQIIRKPTVEDLAIFASSIDKRKGPTKTAIVASNDSVFDCAKHYRSYISHPSTKFEIFRAMDDANQWLQEKV
jgi:hypothetical protein